MLARLLPALGTSVWGCITAFSAARALCAGVAAAGVWAWGRAASKRLEE